jgi:hypothetical protein
MNTGNWIAAGLNVIQAVAIVLAAGLGVFQVRSRENVPSTRRARRRRISAPCGVTRCSSEASMKNTGGAEIPLRAKILRVATFAVGDLDSLGRAKWSEIAHASVFRNHEWIESKLGG